MKGKMVIALGISTLLAASLSFALPTIQLTDDMSSSPSPTDNGTSMTAPNADAPAQGNGDATMQPPADPNATTPPSSSSSGNSNDDMNADTATGDDDY